MITILGSGIVTAAETFVQPGDSIQAAVDNAVSGDIIIIKPGTYTENIKVTIHNIVIKSESGNPANTIITAKGPAADVFSVESNKVTINGFKITNAGIGHAGISLYESNNCIIENNRVLNNSLGIYLKNSEYNQILNNLIGKGNKGIDAEESSYNTISGNRASKNRYGIYLPNSKENTLLNNTLSNNKEYGILLSTAVSNTVSENEAFNNGRGIHLGNSDSNIISNNNIYLNEIYGLFICPRSDKNRVFNNYFNNTVNAVPNNGTDNVYNEKKTQGTNIVGGPSLAGNYWAKPDGTGFSEINVDSDGDGIIDKKYVLENSSYIDHLPLAAVEQQQLILPYANFSANITGGPAPLSVSFKDSSENATNSSWDFENDGIIDTSEKNPVNVYTIPGLYTVNLTASNENGTASKQLIISVITDSPEKKNIISIPGFELIYGVFSLVIYTLYKRG